MTHSLTESLEGRSPDQWALDFLAAAHLPATPSNVQAVVSWEYAESAGGGGKWNPLNTTQGGYAGETDLNSVGVKNFARYEDGIAANARVIRNGLYPRVVDAFTRGNNARTICDLITESPWGTGPITLRGVVQPTPPLRRRDMQIIATGHKPTLTGRTACAVWDSDHPDRVALTNGARLRDDRKVADGLHVWTPPVTAGAHGIGITATVGRDGRPDGYGIVLQDSAGATFVGPIA